jgi:hypothetical protein
VSSYPDVETRGGEGVKAMYRAVLETYPDGLWSPEDGKMIAIPRVRHDGSVETVRAVFGHFTHRGTTAYDKHIMSKLMLTRCCISRLATMISAVFEDCIEKQHGVQREVPAGRPTVRGIRSNGMFLYFLRPLEHSAESNQFIGCDSNSVDEIEAFYLLLHPILRDILIEGVNKA